MTTLLLIDELTTTLEQAIAQQDWAQIAQIDERITQLLHLQNGQPFSPLLKEGMKRLRETHQLAYNACQLERQRLKEVMQNLRDSREGVSAYAAMAVSAYEDMAIEEGQR